MKTPMKYIPLFLTAFLLGGCVTAPIYQWGGYESKLYAGYKDQTKMEDLRVSLQAHIAEMDKTGKKAAPGLLAELGTLYLQGGDPAKAKGMYARERETWPESKGLMDALIKNLERQEAIRIEAKK
jgi:hypothetical protein